MKRVKAVVFVRDELEELLVVQFMLYIMYNNPLLTLEVNLITITTIT